MLVWEDSPHSPPASAKPLPPNVPCDGAALTPPPSRASLPTRSTAGPSRATLTDLNRARHVFQPRVIEAQPGDILSSDSFRQATLHGLFFVDHGQRDVPPWRVHPVQGWRRGGNAFDVLPV